ncbi:MAG: PQQ-dependent sugar dehydrogenase [Salaquimonas sp.]|nr:PQQ-dependent sugar dehydrogenase [Salaquimonas sp.]
MRWSGHVLLASSLFFCSCNAEAAIMSLSTLTNRSGVTTVVDIKPSGADGDAYMLSLDTGSISRYNAGAATGAVNSGLSSTPLLAGIPDPDFYQAYSIAFAPDYATSGKVYMSYSTTGRIEKVVEFTRGTDGNLDPSTLRTIITIDQSTGAQVGTHYGGDLSFGPDGMFYVTTGESDSPLSVPSPSQNVGDLRGGVLRLDLSGDAYPGDDTRNYAIPADNPDFGPGSLPELWAKGLRNPYKATWDNATYIITDVGEDNTEEINLGSSGANYGWSLYEGNDVLVASQDLAEGDLTFPLYTYAHGDGPFEGISITGGLVYHTTDPELALLDGQYFFSDFSDGSDNAPIWSIALSDLLAGRTDRVTAWTLDIAGGALLNHTATFGVDGEGNLYISDLYGEVFGLSGISGFSSVPLPTSGVLLFGAFGFLALSGLSTRRRRPQSHQRLAAS